MKVFDLANSQRLLVSDNPGIWLVKDGVYSQAIYLPKDADPNSWEEAAQEEYEAAMAEKEETLKKKMESSLEE